MRLIGVVAASGLATWCAWRVWERLQLSFAKAPSLQGHARLSHLVARLIPYYSFDAADVFGVDGANAAIVANRQRGFARLVARLSERPRTLAALEAVSDGLSDQQFTSAYSVPFPFRRHVTEHIAIGSVLASSDGVTVTDLDGRVAYDLTGSYGMNVFGYDFYKECIDAAVANARALGPVLGTHHPLVADNVAQLRAISGLDEVSFHMSGTEAVMQAVRLARFHTGRSHLVRFAGAYHGWWDDVQPGIGNPRVPSGTYTLREMDARSLRVIARRRDIACVLVNPLQALHPNAAAPGDGMLVASDRRAGADLEAYATWLRDLRRVCSACGIALIFDEVFVGFRIAKGGAQDRFDVRADLVTYGKTLGGGLPVGVLCGSRRWMKRYRDDRPSEFCFARGTFNGHPYVMAAMHEFLRRIDEPEMTARYAKTEALWDGRAAMVNRRLADEQLPVRVANLTSIWTIFYTQPSRYNWMLQFYLRAEGLRLSWVGTGRLIFSHDFTAKEFHHVVERLLAACRAMQQDGWWSAPDGLTNSAIKRQILREILRAKFSGQSAEVPPPHAARLDTIGS